jgi:hypothetical protein
MPIQGIDISLNIRNNTNYPQQINVMGNPTNLLDTANATTEYRWDITGFTITFQNFVSVQYKRNIDPAFDTFTWELDGTSLNGLVIALNNLGIGYFNLYDELGSTYIGTYNQNYAFGNLDVFNPSISTTTTTTTTTIAPTTTTTTTSTTTAAPTTSTTTTTTTAAPTTTTSTTTTTTTNLVYSEFTLGYSALNGNDSCAQFLLVPTSYYAVAGTIVLVNGTILYTDTSLTTLAPNGYYSNGGDNWAIVGGNGTLTTQTACNLTTTTTTTSTTAAPTTTTTTTTTTTAAPTTTTTTSTTTSTTTIAFSTFSLQPNNIDQVGACSDWPIGVLDYYTSFGATLQDGTTIYTDTALTTPAADGYYSNGTKSWATSGGTGVLANENACTIISYSIGYNIFNGGSSYTGYNTNIDSCLAGGTNPIVGVFSNNVLGDNEILYLDAALTIPFVSTGGYYWASGGIGIYYYFTYSGKVVGFNDCPTTTTTTTTSTTTTTTTIAPNSATIFMDSFVDYPYGYADSATACALGGVTGVTSIVYYSGTLGNGTILYADSNLTTQFYVDGFFGWYWISGYNFSIGYTPAYSIENYASCPLPTTTTTTSTTTTTTTAAPSLVVTNVVGGWTDDGFGNFTPNCSVFINTTYGADITFSTQVDLAGAGLYTFNTTILAGNTSGTGNGPTLGGFPTSVNNACIVSCDTPSVDFTAYSCYTPQFFISNSSLDVSILGVVYNGTSETYISGQPLPNTTGNGTNLWFGYIGGSYTLDVYWNSSIAGQHITITDFVGSPQCQNTTTGSGIASFPNVTFDGTNVVQIDVADGTC